MPMSEWLSKQSTLIVYQSNYNRPILVECTLLQAIRGSVPKQKIKSNTPTVTDYWLSELNIHPNSKPVAFANPPQAH